MDLIFPPVKNVSEIIDGAMWCGFAYWREPTQEWDYPYWHSLAKVKTGVELTTESWRALYSGVSSIHGNNVKGT